MTQTQQLLDRLNIKKDLEPHFFQATYKFFESLEALGMDLTQHKFYVEKLCLPEYVYIFQVPWEDDLGNLHVQTGYRVQHNRSLGLYKGGLRFHPSVNLDIIKALAFEQTFKNALTGFAMGGGKGGSDFDPKGKSKSEIRRFSISFMQQLAPFIGEDKDIPAGDLGVDGIVLGYMNSTYQNIYQKNLYPLTGKPIPLQGSRMRKEATGYGLMYFVEAAFKRVFQTSLEGKTILISGAGNVGIHAALKAVSLGAKVTGISDSTGYVYDPNGLDIDAIYNHKTVLGKQLNEYPNKNIVCTTQDFWRHPCDIALPCAKEDDLLLDDIIYLHKNHVKMVAEGANIAVDAKAIRYMIDNHIMFGPGKAANAGGVMVSALEIEQNKTFNQWKSEEVDQKLRIMMSELFDTLYTSTKNKSYTLMAGANQLAFNKLIEAMTLRGIY